MQCATCHHEVRSDARFCEACGAPQLRESAGGAADGERRQLTVLFCDLVDSTGLSQRLDPEDMREVIRAYQQACGEAVERFGGHVAQYLGDGLLVYFGYPQAHELDVERAVRAGLHLVEAVRALESTIAERYGERLAARVGIHTGRVVVGPERGEMPAFGEAMNIAARLQALAEPDSVVVSTQVLRLVQGLFLTESLGPRMLKGVAAPVTAFRVLRVSGIRSRLDVAASAGLTPFVGREAELRELLARWDAVGAGTSHAVFVAGEAGIGKSRLVFRFREMLRDVPHTWLECRCSPYAQDSAFHPILELQSNGIGFKSSDTAEQKFARLEAALGRAGFSLPDVVPLFAQLHSLPLPARYAAAKPLPGQFAAIAPTPEAIRRRTIEATRDWLIRMGREQPVALVVEDLHWIDPSTLALLGEILDWLPTTRVLMILTHRPAFEVPWPPVGYRSSMALARLDRETAEHFVREATHGRPLPSKAMKEIIQRTDGVPLFLEELTKAVIDGDLALQVPATLHALLAARLDQLGPAKEVAQLGAVLGREFSLALLRAVWQREEEALESALATVVETGLLHQRGGEPDAVYIFKHALVQEVAYESLLKGVRQRVHAAIGEALEASLPDVVTNQPELVAHHFTAAQLPERAIPYWQQAGQHANERCAHVEAIRHLTRGIECLRKSAPSLERSQQELALQTFLSISLSANRGYAAEEVLASVARARELCDEIGQASPLLPAPVFAVLFGLWSFHVVRGDRSTSVDLAEELLRIAQQAEDPILLLGGHVAMMLVACWQGRYADSRHHAAEVLARYVPEQRAFYTMLYGSDPGVYAHVYDGLSLFMLGFPDQARARLLDAHSLAEESGHAFSVATALAFVTLLHHLRRDVEETFQTAARAVVQCREGEFPLFLGASLAHHGWATMRRGDVSGGTAQIEDAVAQYRATGAQLNVTCFLAELADAYLAAADRGRGLATVEEALRLAEINIDAYYEPELTRLKGELQLLGEADADAAERCFRRALEVAQAQGALSLELRAATSLARLLERRGNGDVGRALLAGVYGRFTEGFDTADLAQARALLAASFVRRERTDR